jgi:hypothetical protein
MYYVRSEEKRKSSNEMCGVSVHGTLFPWPHYSSARISQTGIHALLYRVRSFGILSLVHLKILSVLCNIYCPLVRSLVKNKLERNVGGTGPVPSQNLIRKRQRRVLFMTAIG